MQYTMKLSSLSYLLITGVFAVADTVPAAIIHKADNATPLKIASSWTNNVTPGAADIAIWDSNVSSANTTNVLGASTSWDGIQILNPGGPVQISADGNPLTTGADGIDLSQATQDLTLDNNLVLNVPQYWNVASGRTLTLSGGLAKNAGAAIRFELADGSANVVVSNPPNTLLLNGNVLFGTVNDIDYAAVNSNGEIVGGSTLGLYTANPSGSFNGTVAVIDFITANAAGLAINKNSVVDGLRLNQRNTLNPYWTINTGTKTLSLNSILVTTNVGDEPVYVNGTGPVRIYNTGTDELLLIQNNRAASLIFQSTTPITQQAGAASVTKLGVGTVEIQSASAYLGGTRIYEGTLLISGSGTVGGSPLNVLGGEFSAATGATNYAPATVYSNAVANVAINTDGGTFVQATNLTLRASSHLQFTLANGIALSSVRAPLVITNAGTSLLATNNVSIDILGNISPGQFPLVKYATLGGGGFAALNLGNLQPHISAYLSNNVLNSSIDLVVTANQDPLKWATGNATWDIATMADWQDATGTATTYQQSGIFADSVLFEDSVSGVSPLTVTLNTNVTPSAVAVNTTKNYTITGNGGIGGQTALTKSGSGTLTLATANSFSGGLYLNGGRVSFSSLPNLGSGALNFSGGTLQYNGNSDDISVLTVTFNSGGAVIDDGGNMITFANPVGNHGAGSLTKINSGTLTLNGTNDYSGNTEVVAGTLALGNSTYFNDSPAIIVGHGATLDVSAESPIVLQNQILAGEGVINGGVSAGIGAVVSPATNGVTGTLTINNGDLTISGAILALDVSTTANDLIVVNGNLNLTGGELQLNVSGLLPNGTYKLIQYSGSLLSGAGSSANLSLVGFVQPGKVASLTDANANEIDLVISSAGGANLIWQGDGGNNFWDLGSTSDWTNSAGVAATFANEDNVTFNDTSPNQTVNLLASLQPNSVTVNATANYTFQDGSGTGAGKISGTSEITKSGRGTLILLTANNNSGGTLIHAGTVQIGNGSATGDIGTGNITNNGALIFDQTDSRNVVGQINGTGSFTQQGLATLTLTANNSYSGATTIAAGVLQVGNGGATGTLGGSPVTDNTTLVIDRSNTYLLNNGISGAGALIANGPGYVILSGVNTYHGNTYISNGIIKLGASEVIPDATTVPGTVGALIINGPSSALDLNGFNETVNELLGASGFVTNSATSGTSQLTVGDSNNITYGGQIVENPVGGRIALVKAGSGSLELDGANNYSGGTFVGAGTLTIGSAGTVGAANSSITLSNNTTLYLGNAGSTHSSVANSLFIADDAAVTFNSGNVADAINGPVTGSASATNLIIGPVSFGGNNIQQFQNFAGTVQIQSGGSIRFSATAGLNNGGNNALFDLEGGSLFARNNGVISLGALTGNASGSITGPSVSGTGTYLIGAKGVDSAFPGSIQGQNNVVKVGPGTLTLNGATNVTTTLNGDGSTSTNFSLGNLLTYTGTTTISNGVLTLVAPAALTTSPNITLAAPSAVLDVDQAGYISGSALVTNSLLEIVSAQTLTGIGTIRGNVLADAGSTVNIGLPAGLLTITTNVELAGTVIAALSPTNSPNSSELAAQSIVIDSAATLTINNAGGPLYGGQVFQLFSQPVSGFASVTLPPISSPLYWTNKLAIDGSIEVLNSAVNTNATTLVSSLSGAALTLTWPNDHLGWHLQVQTNSLEAGLSTNWIDVAGTSTTNQIIMPINPTNGAVFFRLTYP
jgi:autotransporter-associated beta strand protein